MLAANSGHEAVVVILLHKEADMHATDNVRSYWFAIGCVILVLTYCWRV